MKKTSIYATKRLLLRGIGWRDARDIVRWRSDPANYGVFFRQSPLSLNEHMAWFKEYIQDETRYDFVIIEQKSNRSIGTVTISHINRRLGSCEVSYMLGERSARGMGYASEAVDKLCIIAKEELNIHVFDALILPQNVKSIALAERLGFHESHRVYRRRI